MIAFVLICGLGAVVAFMTATVGIVVAKAELHRASKKKRSGDNRHGSDGGACSTSYCLYYVHYMELYHTLPVSVYSMIQAIGRVDAGSKTVVDLHV